jgi:hypothetical protein
LAANGSIGVASKSVRDRSRTISVDRNLPSVGLGHHPRGGVDRIAEHTVRAAVWRPEVAGEHLARVHADAHRHEAGLVHDLAEGAQHPLLVMAGARRGAGGQQRLTLDLPTSVS